MHPLIRLHCAAFISALCFLTLACQKSDPSSGGPVQQVQESNESVSGTLTVDPTLADQISDTDVLYIMAKRAGTVGGPPVAVARLSHLKFPLKYTLSQENVMISGDQLDGKINITARISKTGDAIGQMGDLSGEYPGNPVSVGESGIDFVIDTPNP